eukprot:scaffold31257_cov83-Skeletonema_dohrnii-CCMP3373.AAC.4
MLVAKALPEDKVYPPQPQQRDSQEPGPPKPSAQHKKIFNLQRSARFFSGEEKRGEDPRRREYRTRMDHAKSHRHTCTKLNSSNGNTTYYLILSIATHAFWQLSKGLH